MIQYFCSLIKNILISITLLLFFGCLSEEAVPVQTPPSASFVAEPFEGSNPLTVIFINTSDPGTGSNLEFEWNFGNGDTSTDENPIYTYETPFSFEISLTATSSHGMSVSEITEINVLQSHCEENFIYFDNVPSSVTLYPNDSCFFSGDYVVLEYILNSNELNNYSNPLEMGTQTWINGRLKNWVADYNFTGSGLTQPISVLPESINNWTELAYLALQWNNLTTIPESLGQLSSLSSLYISNNQLSELPESLESLSNLFFLDLGYNQIEEIPESICNLENLSYLWLFNNSLSEMPECICNLNVEWSAMDGAWYPYFAIGGNYLCENLPNCIANSEHLDSSLDQFIYSFIVLDTQDCAEDSVTVSN